MVIDPQRLAAISKWLSDELDDRATLAEQVAICGAVLVAAAMLLPPAERLRHLSAHLAALQEILRLEAGQR